MSEKFSSGIKNSKQTNIKQISKFTSHIPFLAHEKLFYWFWWRFWNDVHLFCTISLLSTLEKSLALHLPNFKNISLVEIGPMVLEEKIKMWKVYRLTDWRTNNGRSEQLTFAKKKVYLNIDLNKVSLSCTP